MEKLNLEFYIETPDGYIFEDSFREAGSGVSYSCIDSEDGTRINAGIYNDGNSRLNIKRAGIWITGFDNIFSNDEIAVFIDSGKSAWAGVKKLDYFEGGKKFGVIDEQSTLSVTEKPLQFHRSDLQTVINSGQVSVLLGFLGQVNGANKIDIFTSCDDRSVSYIEAWQEFDIGLATGQKIPMDDFVIRIGQNPYDLLEDYATLVQKAHGRQFVDKPITGMMTWYGYHAAVSEEVVLRNAKMIRDFFNGYPQQSDIYMLIDHGWQYEAEWGSLESDVERFPNGMHWLGVELGKLGLKFGIWHTPFCITEYAKGVEEMKSLAAVGVDGRPYEGRANVWSVYPDRSRGSSRKLFYPDGALDEVQLRWEDELREFRQWGANYCKMDFFALMKGHITGRDMTRGQLYQRSWESFRKGFGNGHIAPCSCDTNMQLGYCDSIRIATDIGEAGTWPGAADKYKYGHSTIAAMWYKNRKFWVNDPDSIQVGKGCSMGEARVRATEAAMSGGHIMLSEDLGRIDPGRLELIKRILPPVEETARPLNLFENPFPDGYPSVWRMSSSWTEGPSEIIALFNLERKTCSFNISPEDMGISENSEYIALDWWEGRWLGKFKGPVEVEVAAEDTVLIHAVPISEVPAIVSISHHFTGGYILENVVFDSGTGELTGEIVTKPGIRMVLYGHKPESWEIPVKMRAHVIGNSLGGWQMEIETDSTRTRFVIPFKRKES